MLYTTLAAILPLMESAPLGAEAILCDKATQYMTKHPNVTVSDIARRYGFTESKVRSMLHRSRTKFRSILEKEGYR